MQKFLLSFLVLSIMIGLASVDYLTRFDAETSLNHAGNEFDNELVATPPTQIIPPVTIAEQNQPPEFNAFADNLITRFPQKYPYQIISRHSSLQLFETFDLSSIPDIEIYRLQLNPDPSGVDGSEQLIVYQIRTLTNQPELTFLNSKLAILSQLDSEDQLNKVEGYGDSAFFYNSPYDQNTAFLLTLVKNTIIGFQYSKQDPQAFEKVRQMIEDVSLFPADA